MIRINGLNLSFSGNKIFQDQNFLINQGDKLLLYKESGAGKTTLLKLIQGLKTPDSGTIVIDNLELNKKNLEEIRKKIFYLDQDVSLPELPVIELLHTINGYKSNKNSNIDVDKFKKYLKEFRLKSDTLEKNIDEISGGERQRIGIIIGLLLDRPIWLLDEPTSALDKRLKEKIVNLITSLPKRTVLVISHDAEWHDLKTINWEV